VRQTDTLVIGAGQAGLAISSCLSALGIDHVLIERGRVAERWCSQRWDSLRLLTPNWMTRLPGYAYSGPDPEGFMARDEVAAFLSKYGEHSRAPVFCHTRVERVSHTLGGYLVTTDRGNWIARSVVLATGACDHAAIPEMARNLPGDIRQISPSDYSRPDCLPAGGVLVVGASATGIQLADEISRSGRDVTLAAGRHVRMPRRYRGRDIMDWMDASGFLNQTADSVRDLASARRQPSLQLAGGRGNAALDLHALQSRGVRITGRAARADGTRMFFEPDLATQCAASEARRQKVLAMIDTHIARAPGRARRSRSLENPGYQHQTHWVARSQSERHSQHHLGDGIPPRLFLAQCAGPRCSRRACPRQWHHPWRRSFCHWPAVLAASQFHLHRRRRQRRF
jgi:putative flavoprotein involved in K+ transport